jgi:hypothetical protein
MGVCDGAYENLATCTPFSCETEKKWEIANRTVLIRHVIEGKNANGMCSYTITMDDDLITACALSPQSLKIFAQLAELKRTGSFEKELKIFIEALNTIEPEKEGAKETFLAKVHPALFASGEALQKECE